MSKQHLLNEILDQIGDECKELIEHLGSCDGASLEQIEVSFRQMAQRIGGKFIELYVQERECGRRPKRIDCSCGRTAELEGYRPRLLQTLIGTARIERAYYHCPGCGSGFAPVDDELGVTRRQLSRALERVICRLCAVESFEHAVVDLYDVAGISVSAKEAQLVSESVGAKLAQEESAYVDAVFAEEIELEVDQSPAVLCVQLDGKIVPTRDGGRELKVAAISELLSGKDPARMDVGETTYLGRFIQACDFGRYVWVEAARRGCERAETIIGVGDGAPWIWNLMGEHFPEAVQILDFYHASEHIWELGGTLYGEGSEKARRFADYKVRQIRSGDVAKTIAALAKLKPVDKEKQERLRLEIGYFKENKHRMDYPRYRRCGYHIGSGIVESACKQFGARLDQAGMRWNEPGAGAIAALRATKLSGRWDDYFRPPRPPLYA